MVVLAGALFGVLRTFFAGEEPFLVARMRSLKCALARFGGSRFCMRPIGGAVSPDSVRISNLVSCRAFSVLMRLLGVSALRATMFGSSGCKISLGFEIAPVGSLTALVSSISVTFTSSVGSALTKLSLEGTLLDLCVRSVPGWMECIEFGRFCLRWRGVIIGLGPSSSRSIVSFLRDALTADSDGGLL